MMLPIFFRLCHFVPSPHFELLIAAISAIAIQVVGSKLLAVPELAILLY